MDLSKLLEIKNAFVKELQDAANGTKTSLPFIRHTLSPHSIVQNNETFQTIAVGGSFYQKAIMKKENDDIKIINYSQAEQPPFLTESALLTFMDQHIDPKVTTVGLNFAYPLEPITRNYIVDGVLKSGSKENTFTGLIGKEVGKTIEDYFKTRHNRTITVATANDTICLLLSGLVQFQWNQLSAGIVGTGLNFALFLEDKTAVNLEAAYFNKFTQSEAGREIDAFSVSPGDAIYEKEVSGAYLFKHFNFLNNKKNLGLTPIATTKELETYLHSGNSDIAQTAREVLDHSAALVAAQIAGIMEFCKRDLVFIMQGSLYWKSEGYKEYVEKMVIELSPGYKASFEQVLHADLFGAAKLIA
jgi:hexokinase